MCVLVVVMVVEVEGEGEEVVEERITKQECKLERLELSSYQC
jgi:hypothetical protein